MRYCDYVKQHKRDQIIDASCAFTKLAGTKEKKNQSHRDALKDLALVGGGTALGAGAGYGISELMKKRWGLELEAMSPKSRIKVLTPLTMALGGTVALTTLLRQRSEARKRRKNDKTGHK
jgi:hypothetical protein